MNTRESLHLQREIQQGKMFICFLNACCVWIHDSYDARSQQTCNSNVSDFVFIFMQVCDYLSSDVTQCLNCCLQTSNKPKKANERMSIHSQSKRTKTAVRFAWRLSETWISHRVGLELYSSSLGGHMFERWVSDLQCLCASSATAYDRGHHFSFLFWSRFFTSSKLFDANILYSPHVRILT